MTVPIGYDVVIERADENRSVVIPWGDAPNWIEEYREDLERATGIAYIPKEGVHLPVVRIELGGDRRWVLFSRVAGTISSTPSAELRVYCIGWQRTVEGHNVKALTWVYPSGAIESADEPTMIGAFLRELATREK
jgi:hypothetical protein